MCLVSNYSLLSCLFSSPWLHLTAVQLQRAGCETLPFGSNVYWPQLPSRQRWEPGLGRRIWPRLGGFSPVQVQAHPPAALLQKGSTGTAAHLRHQQLRHEFFNSSVHRSSSCFRSNSLQKMCNLSFMRRWNSCINSYWVHTTVSEKSGSVEG